MSSFGNPHKLYLFALKNGKKKLAYGQTPEDALRILGTRLTKKEMAQIVPTEWRMFQHQREIHQHLQELG